MQQKRVGILIFNEVEVLDYCGPFEVFSVTRLDESSRQQTSSPFQVFLIAQEQKTISATGGLRALPDFTIDNCPDLDVLLVPGGWGTRTEVNNTDLIDWIRRKSTEVKLLTSVCTGAVLLGKTGLLDGKQATTHWKALDWFRETCPNVHVIDDQHVVQQGNIFTSAGISAGIDLALKVVTHYFGVEVGQNTARHMEYYYDPANRRRIELEIDQNPGTSERELRRQTIEP